jgi:uncharacterized membrane protein HdeD (DUF308 family)
MTEKQNPLREQLLAQGEPARDKLVRYREETQAMLEKLDRRLRLQKWYSGGIWIYAVLFMTAYLLFVGFWGVVSPQLTVMAVGFMLLISAGIEIVKYFINRSRVEVLKELKGIELQVMALEERLSNTPRKP